MFPASFNADGAFESMLLLYQMLQVNIDEGRSSKITEGQFTNIFWHVTIAITSVLQHAVFGF